MTASSDRLLRRTLWGNAAFSTVSGAILAIFAGPFATLAAEGPLSIAGLDIAQVFEWLGLGVVVLGVLCGIIASRPVLPEGWARLIFAADLAWVVGSLIVLLLMSAPLTLVGMLGIGIVALIVADFAILEYLGLRRLNAAP